MRPIDARGGDGADSLNRQDWRRLRPRLRAPLPRMGQWTFQYRDHAGSPLVVLLRWCLAGGRAHRELELEQLEGRAVWSMGYCGPFCLAIKVSGVPAAEVATGTVGPENGHAPGPAS